jgi:rubrerythrin
MNNFHNKSFDNLGSVLDSVRKDLRLDYGVKQQEFIKLWPKIIGAKFQNSSKIAYIYKKYGFDVLMVGVSSSTVAQELTFFKADIINKIKKLAKDFEYNIQEIYFDPKLWEEVKTTKEPVEESGKQLYKLEKSFTEEELEKMELPQSILQSLEKSLEDEIFPSKELKEKMMKTIINDLKKQEWMKNNGFPVCADCGIPITFYYTEGDNFCPICRLKK